MESKKSDTEVKISEDKSKKLNYVRCLIGLAVLLFAFVIGHNAFVIPEIDNTVQTVADSTDFKEEKVSWGDGGAKININNSKKEELEKLSGIGEQTALKIIEYRETHGGFSSKEELMEVSGIGKKIFEKIKNNIVV